MRTIKELKWTLHALVVLDCCDSCISRARGLGACRVSRQGKALTVELHRAALNIATENIFFAELEQIALCTFHNPLFLRLFS
jgi:hypothetical protein